MFEDQLIEMVKKHPCIYDKSKRAYKNKLQKEKAWMDVSSVTGEDVEHCQSRWRSLRDRYLKEIRKKSKSGSAASEQSQWKFLPALDFLRMHVAPRRRNSISQCNTKTELLSPTNSEMGFFDEEIGIDESLGPPKANRETGPFGMIHRAVADELASAVSLRCVEHATKQFDLFVNAATNYMSAKKDKSRNEEYYRVLDGYLTKLPEDIQDRLKFKFLQTVVSEIEQLNK